VTGSDLDGMQVEEDVLVGLADQEEVYEFAMVWDQVSKGLCWVGQGEVELVGGERGGETGGSGSVVREGG
jgi:hypothetical protein